MRRRFGAAFHADGKLLATVGPILPGEELPGGFVEIPQERLGDLARRQLTLRYDGGEGDEIRFREVPPPPDRSAGARERERFSTGRDRPLVRALAGFLKVTENQVLDAIATAADELELERDGPGN